MRSRLSFSIVVMALILTGLTRAETVLVVSDCLAPGEAGTDHRDDTLVWFIESLGYDVDVSGMNGTFREAHSPWLAGNEAKLEALEAADLVIVSRRTSSGSYDSDRLGWNSLSTPLLLQSGYLIRGENGGERWGWSSGACADADLAIAEMLSYPDGESLGIMFDWANAPTAPEGPAGVYLPDWPDEIVDAATILGTLDGRPMLIDIPAGTDLDAWNGTEGKYGVLGGARAFLGQWSYDIDEYTFESLITEEYKALLAETMAAMIPEPATVTLLGLGSLAMTRRRRRA